MTDTLKIKDASPLVKTVLALDTHIAELERISQKLEELPMKSDFDFQQARKLLALFAEHGEGVTSEVHQLAARLNETQVRAAAFSEKVAQRAAEIQSRDVDQQNKWAQFNALTEKVRQINVSVLSLKTPEGENEVEVDRQKIIATLVEMEKQLPPLIHEAQTLHREAREMKMKELEKNAESLARTLVNVREKVQFLGAAPAMYPPTESH